MINHEVKKVTSEIKLLYPRIYTKLHTFLKNSFNYLLKLADKINNFLLLVNSFEQSVTSSHPKIWMVSIAKNSQSVNKKKSLRGEEKCSQK